MNCGNVRFFLDQGNPHPTQLRTLTTDKHPFVSREGSALGRRQSYSGAAETRHRVVGFGFSGVGAAHKGKPSCLVTEAA